MCVDNVKCLISFMLGMQCICNANPDICLGPQVGDWTDQGHENDLVGSLIVPSGYFRRSTQQAPVGE